ncbi:MAG: hypothetical protein HUJ56_10765 [Erysipelotrichaceae bacterium]|nr:hypothetical protein [Erysipelotrichaceae bacterium]
MSNKIILMLLCLLVLSACHGKGTSMNSSDNKLVLTDRQKEILANEGLPTDPEQLNLRQRTGIRNIERMMQYLDEKYPNDTFTFIEYAEMAPGVDPETLYVYLGSEEDGIKIKVTDRIDENKEYVYADDYDEAVALPAYINEVSEYLTGKGSKRFFIDTTVSSVSDASEDVIAKTAAFSMIFIENTFSSENEMEEFVREFGEWVLSKNPVYSTIFNFYFQNKEDAFSTTKHNFLDMKRNDRYEYKLYMNVNKDGSIEINR